MNLTKLIINNIFSRQTATFKYLFTAGLPNHIQQLLLHEAIIPLLKPLKTFNHFSEVKVNDQVRCPAWRHTIMQSRDRLASTADVGIAQMILPINDEKKVFNVSSILMNNEVMYINIIFWRFCKVMVRKGLKQDFFYYTIWCRGNTLLLLFFKTSCSYITGDGISVWGLFENQTSETKIC